MSSVESAGGAESVDLSRDTIEYARRFSALLVSRSLVDPAEEAKGIETTHRALEISDDEWEAIKLRSGISSS